MTTDPPIPTRLTAAEWITFACSYPYDAPLAVTVNEWTLLCNLFNWDKLQTYDVRFCDRAITIVTGEPAWYITNT
jgi:hypothetical protein